MSTQLRFGLCLEPTDAFWVEIREAVFRRGKEAALEIVPIKSFFFDPNPSTDEQRSVLDEIASQELDVMIGWHFPEHMAYPLLNMGIPIVMLTETLIDHPLCVSPYGLQAIARQLTDYLAHKLNCEGHIVAIGGWTLNGFPDDGRTRLIGIQEALREYPRLQLTHIPSTWINNEAYVQVRAALEQAQSPVDAVFGLSDSLALLGKDAALKLGCCRPDAPVVGINGDPLALAEIIQGNMAASVETPADDLANQAFEIALKIAHGKTFPRHFEYKSRLITSENVAQVAAEKLVAIAHIPDHLVGFKRRDQEEYLAYLETSMKISRQIGSILDYDKLPAELAKLISTNYGYDRVQLFYWSEREQVLTLVNVDSPGQKVYIPLLQSGVLSEALTYDEPVFIPDAQRSFRFDPDPDWPNTRCVAPGDNGYGQGHQTRPRWSECARFE